MITPRSCLSFVIGAGLMSMQSQRWSGTPSKLACVAPDMLGCGQATIHLNQASCPRSMTHPSLRNLPAQLCRRGLALEIYHRVHLPTPLSKLLADAAAVQSQALGTCAMRVSQTRLFLGSAGSCCVVKTLLQRVTVLPVMVGPPLEPGTTDLSD